MKWISFLTEQDFDEYGDKWILASQMLPDPGAIVTIFIREERDWTEMCFGSITIASKKGMYVEFAYNIPNLHEEFNVFWVCDGRHSEHLLHEVTHWRMLSSPQDLKKE